jgi:hypothetical protein
MPAAIMHQFGWAGQREPNADADADADSPRTTQFVEFLGMESLRQPRGGTVNAHAPRSPEPANASSVPL